jgi:hypothetical protein
MHFTPQGFGSAGFFFARITRIRQFDTSWSVKLGLTRTNTFPISHPTPSPPANLMPVTRGRRRQRHLSTATHQKQPKPLPHNALRTAHFLTTSQLSRRGAVCTQCPNAKKLLHIQLWLNHAGLRVECSNVPMYKRK